MTVHLKLTVSYAGFLVAAGVPLLGATVVGPNGTTSFVPDRSDLLQSFTPAAIAVLLVLLLLGLAGRSFLAGPMLAPLTRIGDAARLAAKGSLSHRIALDGPHDEMRELADVFDAMLERLEEHLAEQQRFAANASHEPRTPLAISQALLDVACADPERDVRALISRLHDVNTRHRTDRGAPLSASLSICHWSRKMLSRTCFPSPTGAGSHWISGGVRVCPRLTRVASATRDEPHAQCDRA
jgi:two-component system, OmpR family, sensor histidine kinase VanS